MAYKRLFRGDFPEIQSKRALSNSPREIRSRRSIRNSLSGGNYELQPELSLEESLKNRKQIKRKLMSEMIINFEEPAPITARFAS